MALKKWLLAQGVPASEVNARGPCAANKWSGRPGKRIGKGDLLHLADTYGLRGAAPSNGSAWYTPAWSSCTLQAAPASSTYVQTPPRSKPVSNRTMQRSLDADVNRVKKEAKVEDTKKYNAQLAAAAAVAPAPSLTFAVSDGGIAWRGEFTERPVSENFRAKFELGPGVEWASEWRNGPYVELRKQGEADCVDYYRLHSDRQGGFEWKTPPSEPGTYVFVLRSSGDPWPAQFAEQTIRFVTKSKYAY